LLKLFYLLISALMGAPFSLRLLQPLLVAWAAKASGMKANPILRTPEELAEILARAL
jgi:hypothetical protein